jgi:hypothetical protein
VRCLIHTSVSAPIGEPVPQTAEKTRSNKGLGCSSSTLLARWDDQRPVHSRLFISFLTIHITKRVELADEALGNQQTQPVSFSPSGCEFTVTTMPEKLSFTPQPTAPTITSLPTADMAGWWICCSCRSPINPVLSPNACMVCRRHYKCPQCYVYPAQRQR